MKLTRLTIRVPDALHSALTARAKAARRPVSEEIRIALENHLATTNPQTVNPIK